MLSTFVPGLEPAAGPPGWPSRTRPPALSSTPTRPRPDPDPTWPPAAGAGLELKNKPDPTC
jgi:hypothetical protein